jgi:hypothetical protein
MFDLHPSDHGVRDFEGVAMIDGPPHCRAALEVQAARHDLAFDDLVVINHPVKLVLGPMRKNASAAELASHQKAKQALEELTAKIAIASSPPSAAPGTPGRRRRIRARGAGSARHKQANWSAPTARSQRCSRGGRPRSRT